MKNSIPSSMKVSLFQDIKKSLRELYLEDERPWLVGWIDQNI